MDRKLLTIVIPTYNRSGCLVMLLEALTHQLSGLQEQVEVIVSDNASTDATPAVVEAFRKTYPAVTVMRHSENVGPDENFCRCLDRVGTRFFWMIGDDDLPKVGVVAQVVEWLRRDDPDLLYLASEWLPRLTGPGDGIPLASPEADLCSRVDFARQVHVWVTFISGMVVNMARLRELNRDVDFRRFAGTNLVQLGWVLPMLKAGSRFYVCSQPCILATSGNTGGYKLLAVFGTNLPHILGDVFGDSSRVRQLIIDQLAWSVIPHLIRVNRFEHLGDFAAEDVRRALAPLKSSLAYWCAILPLALLPTPLARAFTLVSRGYTRLERLKRFARRAVMTARQQLSFLFEYALAKAYSLRRRLRGYQYAWRFGSTHGPIHLGPDPQISGSRHIHFLGRFVANRRFRIEAIDKHNGVQYAPCILIGDNVSVENDCHIGAVNRVEIHDHVLIASGVYISDHSHGGTDLDDLRLSPHSRRVTSKGPVIVESCVWLGEGVAVMPGVRIGHHSVIGANAVVTSDIPPYSVAVGCPARIVKSHAGDEFASAQTAHG